MIPLFTSIPHLIFLFGLHRYTAIGFQWITVSKQNHLGLATSQAKRRLIENLIVFLTSYIPAYHNKSQILVTRTAKWDKLLSVWLWKSICMLLMHKGWIPIVFFMWKLLLRNHKWMSTFIQKNTISTLIWDIVMEECVFSHASVLIQYLAK